jgi:adenylosuccinate lyase
MSYDEIQALSPLDSRYAHETELLRNQFSEYAFMRDRVRVEIDYIFALSRDAKLIRPLSEAEQNILQSIVTSFSVVDAREIKSIEAKTRHDVKAIEIFLRGHLSASSLSDIVEWLHFGLTSEDVNLIAQAIALKESRDTVILPALGTIADRLANLAREYKQTPMLARTHGQVAVPTTLGKEFAIFYSRLKKQYAIIDSHKFEAKLDGAVGNFNAHVAALPQIDWMAFSSDFIRSYGLEPNLITTQLLPYENWLRYFDAIRMINSILIDAAQDLWRYISDDYLQSRVVAGEVGSSTMPQKVNPIDFENAEGNLGIANALFEHYARKLPISRLQRDLSDSTVRRTFGVALGHSLVAYVNFARGLDRIQVNEVATRADLESHWQVIAEGAQTILRAASVPNAYDLLKTLTRGKEITQSDFGVWIDHLSVDESIKKKLRRLSPLTYLGLAEQIVERALSNEAPNQNS